MHGVTGWTTSGVEEEWLLCFVTIKNTVKLSDQMEVSNLVQRQPITNYYALPVREEDTSSQENMGLSAGEFFETLE
jgi:hypothetical protein